MWLYLGSAYTIYIRIYTVFVLVKTFFYRKINYLVSMDQHRQDIRDEYYVRSVFENVKLTNQVVKKVILFEKRMKYAKY